MVALGAAEATGGGGGGDSRDGLAVGAIAAIRPPRSHSARHFGSALLVCALGMALVRCATPATAEGRELGLEGAIWTLPVWRN